MYDSSIHHRYIQGMFAALDWSRQDVPLYPRVQYQFPRFQISPENACGFLRAQTRFLPLSNVGRDPTNREHLIFPVEEWKLMHNARVLAIGVHRHFFKF